MGSTRAQARRRQRRKQPGARSRPRKVLSLETYPAVKQGHIVPRCYQSNFAVGNQVAMHVDGRPCVTVNIDDAGTRKRFYRRTRPDGTDIDDFEASLNVLEAHVAPVLAEIAGGAALTNNAKVALAQFVGMQMVRGPAFFDSREELLEELLAELDENALRPEALALAGGDAAVVKAEVLRLYASPTHALHRMLLLSTRLASIVGHMRWHLMSFHRPLLVYSDHPVVLWPARGDVALPFEAPRYGPLTAAELRVALSPRTALLMSWADGPSRALPLEGTRAMAGELNAFTISQAERQWMHRPGDEPPIITGYQQPLTRLLDGPHAGQGALGSRRHAEAARYLQRVGTDRYLDDVSIMFDVA